MPSLKDTKRRIVSVKNTQKITHAMKLVSAAKFSRANQAVIAARPYGAALDDMVARLASMAGESIDSPLVRRSVDEKRSLVVVISSDRGLCGSLNTNLFKSVGRFVKEKRAAGVELHVAAWGKRAQLFIRKSALKLVLEKEKVLDKPNYNTARKSADDLVELFVGSQEKLGYDRVYLAYVEFKSALSQQPVVKQLLPVGGASTAQAGSVADVIVEPELKVIVPQLLKKQVASLVFRAFLEGAASEHGARMTAMDSATKNAKEVIRKLTLLYNRARQAAITKELIEITSGAEAL
jgi:F-type H+-transporting ATPase subunit gamma